MRLKIVPYKKGSKSAKLLAQFLSEKLGKKVWRGEANRHATNIGWGNTKIFPKCAFLNHPIDVACARDKLSTFEELGEHVPIPPYTTDKAVAEGWLSDGQTVLARTTTGQGGSGITICSSDTGIVDAPLYTLYIKKKKEFRVHVVHGEVVMVHQKRKRNGADPDTMIRSHTRGWVFCKNNIEEPEDLRKVAVKAVKVLNLHFGAVDVIWNRKRNCCYVLEVNTAPGLCPQTAAAYSARIVDTLQLGTS